MGAARKALAMRMAAPSAARPSSGKTADKGMNPVESAKAESKVAPAKVGSVSQANKRAQAQKDS